MNFLITGLPRAPFAHLINASDAELAACGAARLIADDATAFPCRVSLAHAEIGERVLLLNHEHQPAATPYRSAHAIFVREAARVTYAALNEIPDVMRIRTLSVRAFDAADMMVDAELVAGSEASALFEALLVRPEVAYLHVHYAKRGCYAARVDRGTSAL